MATPGKGSIKMERAETFSFNSSILHRLRDPLFEDFFRE